MWSEGNEAEAQTESKGLRGKCSGWITGIIYVPFCVSVSSEFNLYNMTFLNRRFSVFLIMCILFLFIILYSFSFILFIYLFAFVM